MKEQKQQLNSGLDSRMFFLQTSSLTISQTLPLVPPGQPLFLNLFWTISFLNNFFPDCRIDHLPFKIHNMTKQFLTINRQFLDQYNYEQTSQNSKNLNNKYGELCELFRKEFQALANDRTKLPSIEQRRPLVEDRRRKFQFLQELKIFIRDFMSILKEQGDYQVNCLEILKDSNHPNLEITQRIIAKVQNNKELCHQLEDKRNVLVQIYAEIKKNYKEFQEQITNPAIYYQPKLVLAQQADFKDKMNKDWKLMSEILAKREEYEGKIDEFEPYLSTYRKKLISNKYEVLKKIVNLISNIKIAIIEIFGTLRNCSIDKRKDYLKVIQSQQDDINYLQDYFQQTTQPSFLEHYTVENKTWEKYTSQSITEFEETFEEVEQIVVQLISFFNNFCNKCNEMQNNYRTLVNEISEFFPESESPFPLMKQLLEVQHHFGKKMSNIVVRLQEIQNKLRLQKNNCKKQAEILLTIIKVNKNNNKSFLENFNKNNELQELISKISFQPTKHNLIALYDEFIDLQNELLSKFKSQPRRPTYDSMDISHTLPVVKTPDKRIPLKQEYWLWREHKSEIEINFEYINQYFKDIEQNFEKITVSAAIKDSTLLEQHPAILIQDKETEGVLQLKINSLQFEANSLKICIPWKEITSVKVASKVWKDILNIETSRGVLQLYKINNVEAVMTEIKETQEKSSLSKHKKIERKTQPELTQEEIAAISTRKTNIQKEVPNLKDYRVIAEEIFSNQRIDQIYQLFYSDKVFNFYGKEQPCFFSYTGKKAGNYNWVAQQYDRPGPYFYSSNPEVTFSNCSLVSTRKITYNHPMKPSAIPFMPKFCLNTDIRKMYWISHEELLYIIDSKTEGVPYSQCFSVSLAHSIKTEGKGVKISISMTINWLENTMMKSMIESNVNPEVEQNMTTFLGQINKVLKLMASLEKGEDVEIPQEQAVEQQMAKPPDEVSKLKLHNKILIVAFLVLILLNLVFVVRSK